MSHLIRFNCLFTSQSKYYHFITLLHCMFLCLWGWEPSTISFQIDVQGTHIFARYFYHALWVAVSWLCYLGWSHDTPLSPMGFFLGFSMVGELQLDQMSFNPLPFLPRNPHMKVTLRVSPWTLSEWCSACIICNQHSVVHTAPHLKVLYSQIRICKQTCRSTFTSWMSIGPASVSNPKFRYLQEVAPWWSKCHI